jgi:hypothetical protein
LNREVTVWTATAAWLAAVVVGFWLWERYDTTPGAAGEPAAARSSPGRWQLTVFAHPHCPCTRASLRELADISRGTPGLSVRILFVRPAGAPAGWERGEAWDEAANVSGAEIACDATGAEARSAGAETSGFAILTDPTGLAVFRGGLTPARGRGGESAGRRAVLAWLGGGNGPATAPVFGCPLFTPDE